MTMNSNRILIPTILCGGAGSRLWPLSREQHPKPFIRLDGKQSLLQQAFLRGANLPEVKETLTVTNSDFFFRVEEEYQQVVEEPGKPLKNRFILEPFGRNTAPAVAAAAMFAQQVHGDDAILLILAADHLILNQKAFTDAVQQACQLAQQGKIVTFGIQPTAPETGYGYIESDATDVVRFVEKPDINTAQEYLLSGKFLWNSGMFCFKAGVMLAELAKYSPDLLDAVAQCYQKSINEADSTIVAMHEASFREVPDDSIDYAVMERTENASVVACDIGWSDIGCWRVLGDQTSPDINRNRIEGDAVVIDSFNCTINCQYKDRLLGVVGVTDLVIVDTPDALLIADKKRSQDVKQIYSRLKQQGHETYKLHRTAHRPWGTYTVLEEGQNFKIKRIEVKPGASLSLQMHLHRSEHWVVVSGTAKVINGDKELILNINESTFIPATHKHRLENISTETMVMIEVQTGTYLGEDDIVRFDDIYGRAVCKT